MIFITNDEQSAIIEAANIIETHGLLNKMSIKSKKRLLRMKHVFSGQNEEEKLKRLQEAEKDENALSKGKIIIP